VLGLLLWRRRLAMAFVLCAAIGCRDSREAANGSAPPVQPSRTESLMGLQRPPDPVVNASFRNVDLHLTDNVTLEVRYLDGALVGRPPTGIPVFDDQSSFTLRIDSAELALSPESLTHLLNDHVLAGNGSALTELDVSIEGGALKQKGKLRKGLAIPFTVVSDVSVTGDGHIRLRPRSISAAGLPSGRLMQLFGIQLDDLIKADRAGALWAEGNDLMLSPNRLLPEPRTEGRLTAIRLEAGRIVQQFGSPPGPRSAPSDASAVNHLYYQGGTLKFGKLTMSDADMELIDADPSDPFDFYPARYTEQLVAGFSKNTRQGGLKVYMPDFDDTRLPARADTTARHGLRSP
jgi:hypothetical protein